MFSAAMQPPDAGERRCGPFGSAVCLTFDVDWAPEAVIEELIDQLRHAGVRATLFATHDSPSLTRLSSDSLEVGLHPNFNDCGGDYDGRLRAVQSSYPSAIGARSHSLYVSSRILDLYARCGLIYESNTFLHLHPHLRPVLRFDGMVSIPFWWTDDVHFSRSRSFTVDALPLGDDGLKVFTFHPIHVFMNTDCSEHYQSFKPHYSDPVRLRPLRNGGPGTGTLLAALLDHIRQRGLRTWTMAELAHTFLRSEHG